MQSLESYLAEQDAAEAAYEQFLSWCEEHERDPEDPGAHAEFEQLCEDRAEEAAEAAAEARAEAAWDCDRASGW